MTCADAEPLLAAAADGLLDATRRSRLDVHLAACASCRAALDDQRQVAGLLTSLAGDAVSQAFLTQVNSRIDDAEGWFGIVDFRAWTLRLAPIAATLAIVAFLGLGAGSASPTSAATTATQGSSTVAFTPSNEADWDRDVTSDALLDAALSRTGDSNAR